MRKLLFFTAIIVGTLASQNAFSQGFLQKMQKLKDKTNFLDNKMRVTWLPFPDENYHIKTITCSYGDYPAYKLEYTYDDWGLLDRVDFYAISPKTRATKYLYNYKTIEYRRKDSIVIIRTNLSTSDSNPSYQYNAYKMSNGRIIGSASSSKYFEKEIPIRYGNYQKDGKLSNTTSSSHTYNDKGLLTQRTNYINGMYYEETYTYDNENPRLMSYQERSGKSKDDTLKLNPSSYKIIQKGKYTEAVIDEINNRERAVVTRDIFGKVVRVTDNLQERKLNATIEYEERPSNDKLFGFKQGGAQFYLHGDIASFYSIPFTLIYFGD